MSDDMSVFAPLSNLGQLSLTLLWADDIVKLEQAGFDPAFLWYFMPADFDFRWAAVILSGLIATIAIGIMFAASMLISSRRYSATKLTTYECGIPAQPFRWSQINVRYYIFAILFLIFDVEAVFLFPWAVVFLDNNVAFYAMMIFLAVLGFALLYGWRKGVLEWSR